MEKVGRNDPCPCGSGKKFKKCCEEKVKHKKFDAQVLPKGQRIVATDKAAELSTNFFKRAIKPVAPPVQHQPPEDHPDQTKPL
jgi:hypothetical protein